MLRTFATWQSGGRDDAGAAHYGASRVRARRRRHDPHAALLGGRGVRGRGDLDVAAPPRQERPAPFRSDTDVVSDIARLRAEIQREAVTTDATLDARPSVSAAEYRQWGLTEYRELIIQLSALHESVAEARSRSHGDLALLRADLATLLSFAKTLRTDAENWRAAFEHGLEEHARQEAAARQERERLAAADEALVRQRDALQAGIDETAKRMAQDSAGECRRTLPVFRLGEAVTICSSIVSSPRRGFRSEKRWLVTLNDSRDHVVVRRAYC